MLPVLQFFTDGDHFLGLCVFILVLAWAIKIARSRDP